MFRVQGRVRLAPGAFCRPLGVSRLLGAWGFAAQRVQSTRMVECRVFILGITIMILGKYAP